MNALPKTLALSGTLFMLLSAATQAVEPWTFVVSGDVMNNDVALDDEDWWGSGLDGVWESDPELAGATSYAALPFFLDAIAAENPDFVLVPGDLMQGRWSLDSFSDAEIVAAADSGDPNFAHLVGLTGVEARKAHIDFMAARYYPDWHQMWGDRGLTVYHIPGDHEYGDNDWAASYDPELIAHYALRYAQYAANNPTNGPAGFEKRAWSLTHKNLTVYGVDEFETDTDGEMATGVTGAQLSWLQSEMTDQNTTFGIVIGHMPVLPGYRFSSSSRLEVPGGSDSDFWAAMVNADIDAYFPGEVHAFSIQEDDGLAQIVSGAQPSSTTRFHYLVCTVYEDRIDIVSKTLNTTHGGVKGKEYDPYGSDDYVQRSVKLTQAQYDAGADADGTMTINKSGGITQYTNRTGVFLSRYTQMRRTVIDGTTNYDLPFKSITINDSVGSIDYAYSTIGLAEDIDATVDTDNEWNAIPSSIAGAEYLKVSQDDSRNSDLDMTIELKSSADIYVLFSDGVSNPPDWLTATFTETDDNLGLDKKGDGTGSSDSIDETYSVWKKRVVGAQTLELGLNHSGFNASMYGLAIVPVADADGDQLGDRWESDSYGDPTLYSGDDDPNHDGKPLLLDYAQDRNGTIIEPEATQDLTVQTSDSPMQWEITQRRSKRADNISWIAWKSSDLQNWTQIDWGNDSGFSQSLLEDDSDNDGSAEELLFTINIPEGDTQPLFVRFEIQPTEL